MYSRSGVRTQHKFEKCWKLSNITAVVGVRGSVGDVWEQQWLMAWTCALWTPPCSAPRRDLYLGLFVLPPSPSHVNVSPFDGGVLFNWPWVDVALMWRIPPCLSGRAHCCAPRRRLRRGGCIAATHAAVPLYAPCSLIDSRGKFITTLLIRVW